MPNKGILSRESKALMIGRATIDRVTEVSQTKTREERKLTAIMKAFQTLEDRQKRSLSALSRSAGVGMDSTNKNGATSTDSTKDSLPGNGASSAANPMDSAQTSFSTSSSDLAADSLISTPPSTGAKSRSSAQKRRKSMPRTRGKRRRNSTGTLGAEPVTDVDVSSSSHQCEQSVQQTLQGSEKCERLTRVPSPTMDDILMESVRCPSPVVSETWSSSDDDLPDGLSTPQSLPVTKQLPKKDDLVWVKCMTWPFWPAVVRYVDKRRRRVSVIFINSIHCKLKERFTLQYNHRKIVPYGQDSDTPKFKKEGLGSFAAEEFRKAVDCVEQYYYRKLLDPSFPSPSVHFNMETDGGSDITDSSEGEEFILGAEEEAESANGAEPTNGAATTKVVECSVSTTLEASVTDRLLKKKQRNEKFVEFIKSSQVKEHVLGIMKGDVPSACHDAFVSKSAPRGRHYGFGPLDDEEQMMSVMSTLESYYRLVRPDRLPDMTYINNVLLPEAMVFAIRRINRIKESLAWERYNKGPRQGKEERAFAHQQLITNASNLTDEDRVQMKRRQAAMLQKFGSPVALENV